MRQWIRIRLYALRCACDCYQFAVWHKDLCAAYNVMEDRRITKMLTDGKVVRWPKEGV